MVQERAARRAGILNRRPPRCAGSSPGSASATTCQVTDVIGHAMANDCASSATIRAGDDHVDWPKNPDRRNFAGVLTSCPSRPSRGAGAAAFSGLAALLGEAALARRAARARRLARAAAHQALADALGQALEREVAVSRLRAGVLRHRRHPLAVAVGEPRLLLGAERRRRLDLEHRLDPRRGHVRVLAARAGRAARAQLDLRERDRQAGADADAALAHGIAVV